jgi:predicted chitinase/predicted DNA-binding ArsR family transcriptional regulator
MKLESAKKQLTPVAAEPQKKQATIARKPLKAQSATPEQLQRSKAKLEQQRTVLQRKVEESRVQRAARVIVQEQTRVQREKDQAVAAEQQARVQRLAETQAKQQSFFSSFSKTPTQRKTLEGVKSSSIQAADVRGQYQTAIQPEIVQRLVNDHMTASIQAARASQTPNALTTRADWFNTELPVLRARHNSPDTPFLDGMSVIKPTDNQAFNLGKTYTAQRLSNGLTPKDAASAILNIQRKPDRDLALGGLLAGINPRQSDHGSIQRLVAMGEANLEVQRQALLEDAGIQQQALQLAKAEANPTNANSGISEKIQAKVGGGNPLPENVRGQLETGLNTNLEGVRVHTDSEADKLTKSVNAVAFTTGKDIFFSSGSFEPNTKSGFELLAHETTHTVQQSQGLVKPGIDSDPHLEDQARTKGAELANTFDPNAKPKSDPSFQNLQNIAQPNSPLISSQPVAQRLKLEALQRSSLAVQREPQSATLAAPVAVIVNEPALASLTTSLLTLVPQKYQTSAQSNIPIILRQCASSHIKNANQVAYILATAQHESRFGSPMYKRSESLVEDHNPLETEHRTVKDKKTGKTKVEDVPFRTNHVTGHRINAKSGDTDDLENYYDDAYGGMLGNAKGTSDGANYRGRGFVQITGRDNYKRLGQQIQKEGFTYTFDNITYGTKEHPIDLEANPTHVNLVPELAAKIMVSGMQKDSFAQKGHGLNDYIHDKTNDFVGARAIVNGSDRAGDIASIAESFAKILNANNAWNNVLKAPDAGAKDATSSDPTKQPVQRSALGLQRETTTSNPSTQTTPQQAEGNALRTFNLSSFTNKQVLADVEFGPSLEKINAIAIKNKVKLYVTSSFRSTSNVGGAIVTPSKKSNHMAGHAIDINIMWGPGYKNFANGDVMASPNPPAPVKAFIQDMEAAGFRWGQRFPEADPVHFDDGLNVNDPKRWIERYKATRLPGGSQPYKPTPSSNPSTQPVQRSSIGSTGVIQASGKMNMPVSSQTYNDPKSIKLQRLGLNENKVVQNIALQRETAQNVQFAQVGFVRDDGLNLRAQASQTSASLAKMPVGTRVVVTAIQDGFFQVLTAFGTGFVAASDDHVHFAPSGYLQQDPGMRMVRVRNGETGMGLVNRVYGIRGNEGGKDKNIWHFLNVIRKYNKPEAFGFKDKGWGDSIQNFFIPGADANNVMLKANFDLWIPSFQIAAAMDVGSGTLGGEVTRLQGNISRKVEDFKLVCSYAAQYTPGAVGQVLTETAGGLLHGLLTFARDAVIIVGGSTAIGALIGFFFGGAGAAPGAAIGFEVGLQILEIYGIKFLLEWIWNAGKQFVDMVGSYGTSLDLFWNANGNQAKLQQSAQYFAHATAQLASLILQAIAAYVLHKGTKAVLNSKFAKTVGETKLGQWIGERVNNQQARRNDGIQRVQGVSEFDRVASVLLKDIPSERLEFYRQALAEKINQSGESPIEFGKKLKNNQALADAVHKRAYEIELKSVSDGLLSKIKSEQKPFYEQALAEKIAESGQTPTQFAKNLNGSPKTVEAIRQRAYDLELKNVSDGVLRKIKPAQRQFYDQALAEQIANSGQTPTQFANNLNGSPKTIKAIQRRAYDLEFKSVSDVLLSKISATQKIFYEQALAEQIANSGQTPTQFANNLNGSPKTIKAIQERAYELELKNVLDEILRDYSPEQRKFYDQAVFERIAASGKTPKQFERDLTQSPETTQAIHNRAAELKKQAEARAQYEEQQRQSRAQNFEYDPKGRTLQQLKDDALGKPRANETPQANAARALAARIEIVQRHLSSVGRSDLIRVIQDVRELEAQGRLSGFADWLKDMYTRQPSQIVDGLSELLEARRLAKDYSGKKQVVIEYGQDGKTGGKSFDIKVEDPVKGIDRKIDVYTPQSFKVGDAIQGISHAAGKIVNGSKDMVEATVCFTKWPPTVGKGLKALPNGDMIIEKTGVVRDNFFDQIVNSANSSTSKVANFENVQALNIIDKNGKLLVRITNSTPGTTGGWRR